MLKVGRVTKSLDENEGPPILTLCFSVFVHFDNTVHSIFYLSFAH